MASFDDFSSLSIDSSSCDSDDDDNYNDISDVPILSNDFITNNYFGTNDFLCASDQLCPIYLEPVKSNFSPVSFSPISFSPVPFSPVSTFSNLLDMEKLGQCRKFSGYSHDNASKFLSEFESFATLYGLDSQKKLAAFHLHLKGPALQWYDGLDSETTESWVDLLASFQDQYIKLGWQSSTVMLESELFQKMSLLPGQTIEDYHSNLCEKGQILEKPDHEVMVRFISGLPEKLAFFVRAGNPRDVNAALASAKLGETFGYRNHDQGASVSAAKMNVKDAVTDDVSELKEQVKSLTTMVQSLAVGNRFDSNQRRSQGQTSSSRSCYACLGQGHVRRNCNWNGVQPANPNDICQICFQSGHQALQCRRFASMPPPVNAPGNAFPQQQLNTGNSPALGNFGRRPRGGLQN